jgi:hypothetical protein
MNLFFIQSDGRYKSRAYKGRWHRAYKGYPTINAGILKLKQQRYPHRLCFKDPKTGSMKTLVHFEGTENLGTFTQGKLRALIKVGTGMYIPKIITRKTNIKRKKKQKCDESSLLNTLKAYAKSTQ